MNSQQARPWIRDGDFSVTGAAEDRLELVVADLEVGLVAVGREQFGVGELAVVVNQGELAVGGGVVATLSASTVKVSVKIVVSVLR